MSTALSAAMLSPKPLFPPLTRDLAVTSLIAGIAADLTWEFWARVITPFLPGVGGPLEPAALVQSVFGLPARLSLRRPAARAGDRAVAAVVDRGGGLRRRIVDLRSLRDGASDRRAAGLP